MAQLQSLVDQFLKEQHENVAITIVAAITDGSRGLLEVVEHLEWEELLLKSFFSHSQLYQTFFRGALTGDGPLQRAHCYTCCFSICRKMRLGTMKVWSFPCDAHNCD